MKDVFLLRVVAVLATAVAMLGVVPAPRAEAVAAGSQAVVFKGGGWGHGVGMAQYGAYGQALDGKSAKDIVTYYYTGSDVELLDGLGIDSAYFSPNRPLWVGLAQGLTTATIEVVTGEAKFCLTPGEGCGDAPVGSAGETWTIFVTSNGNNCKLKREGVVVEDKKGDALKSPGCRVRVDPLGSARVEFGGREYRRGVLEARFAPGTSVFHLSAALSLETYLYGLAEVPSFWPTGALKAQAYAARSYAANRYLSRETPALRASGDPGLSTTRKGECWCHLYATVADQVYQGFSAEYPPWTSAVDATDGKVVTYSGPDSSWTTQAGVIAAFYHSSSSGITESNVTAWGSSSLFPYLAHVDDPWSADPGVNPNASWEVAVSADAVAAALGWDELRRAELDKAPPGAVVRFEGIDKGAPVTIEKTGPEVRTLFGLKSPGIHAVDMEGTVCAGVFATVVGTSAAETLNGTSGPDVIAGLGGADIIKGKGGDDVICGGGGNDDLRGGAGADKIRAGSGADDVTGGSGRDVIRGGSRGDELDGEVGDDTIFGQRGSDLVRGAGGSDVIEGGSGHDTLLGQGGADVLRGQNGADTLKGGANVDQCRGGSGSDTGVACEDVAGIP